jgi:biopolymer transport protein ExbB
VHEEQGSFFLANGKKVRGTIQRIGDIAAFGRSAEGGGGLAPAGEGQLRVWKNTSGQSLPSLSEQRHQGTLQVFLYKSQQEVPPLKEAPSWLATIHNGGPIAWVIFILGCLVGCLILWRALRLNRSSVELSRVSRQLEPRLVQGNLQEAIDYCRQAKGRIGRMLGLTLEQWEKNGAYREDLIAEPLLQQRMSLERFSTVIMVLAGIAPLLGLLGTVTGMIATFDVITNVGTGDPKLLSGGISEALITTMLGLVVAIPALFCGNLLNSWAERLLAKVEKSPVFLLNAYQRHLPTEGVKA